MIKKVLRAIFLILFLSIFVNAIPVCNRSDTLTVKIRPIYFIRMPLCLDGIDNESCYSLLGINQSLNFMTGGMYTNYHECIWNGTNCLTGDMCIPNVIQKYNPTTTTTTTLCNMQLKSNNKEIKICIDNYCDYDICIQGNKDYYLTFIYGGFDFNKDISIVLFLSLAELFIMIIGLVIILGIFISSIVYILSKVWTK